MPTDTLLNVHDLRTDARRKMCRYLLDGFTYGTMSAAAPPNHAELPEFQEQYVHSLEIHDVGLYKFKGVEEPVRLKSFNARAFSARNDAFTGGIKAGKATQVQAGSGLEAVRIVGCPASAVAAMPGCSRVRQAMPRARDLKYACGLLCSACHWHLACSSKSGFYLYALAVLAVDTAFAA